MQSFVLKSYYDIYSIINFAKCIVVRKELRRQELYCSGRTEVPFAGGNTRILRAAAGAQSAGTGSEYLLGGIDLCKSAASVLDGEKEICVISLGYGKTQGVPHKNKPIEKLCNYSENLPDWFLQGMRAAMLAPTATNQQKFRFELLEDGSLKISRGLGFYSKMDLGIVKYHFELGSGKKIF